MIFQRASKWAQSIDEDGEEERAREGLAWRKKSGVSSHSLTYSARGTNAPERAPGGRTLRERKWSPGASAPVSGVPSFLGSWGWLVTLAVL